MMAVWGQLLSTTISSWFGGEVRWRKGKASDDEGDSRESKKQRRRWFPAPLDTSPIDGKRRTEQFRGQDGLGSAGGRRKGGQGVAGRAARKAKRASADDRRRSHPSLRWHKAVAPRPKQPEPRGRRSVDRRLQASE